MAKKTQAVPKTFEDGMRELESILAEVEAGQIGLEESLVRYERGSFLIGHCRSVLSAAQTQVEQLTKSPAGDVQLTPLAEDARATAAEA